MAQKYRKPSRKLYAALKLSPRPQYEYANELEINRAILSQIMNGSLRVRFGDSRVEELGKLLGLEPHECWEQEAE